MMNDIKPIKRSAELIPLSRDHHEELLFSWKLRQGIKKGIEPQRIAQFCSWFWQAHLQKHFTVEEQVLPPILSPVHAHIQRMLNEHTYIKKKIQRISEPTGYDDIEQLAQTLTDHIRFEERILFNEIEKVATEEQLQLVQAAEQKQSQPIRTWKDEFWLAK